MKPLIKVENLVQEFKVNQGILDSLQWKDKKLVKVKKAVHAVNNVSFDIYPKEAFSLVGESGCGKSTTAKTIIRLLDPVSGHIFYNDEDISSLNYSAMMPYRKKMQMIFQDPYASLDPHKNIKSIIMEPILFHKLADNKKDAEEKALNLLEKVGIRAEQATRYPHQFSGGQRQRIGIARALAVEPEFIIADEPVSALDVSIQAQILNLMMDLKEEYGFSYLFIAHDLSVVRHISDRLAVMYCGTIVETGNKKDVFEHVLHPYTKLLFSAVPTIGEDPIVLPMKLEGEPANPVSLPDGCVFSERCPYCMDVCRNLRPELKEIEPGHSVACHLL